MGQIRPIPPPMRRVLGKTRTFTVLLITVIHARHRKTDAESVGGA